MVQKACARIVVESYNWFEEFKWWRMGMNEWLIAHIRVERVIIERQVGVQ